MRTSSIVLRLLVGILPFGWALGCATDREHPTPAPAPETERGVAPAPGPNEARGAPVAAGVTPPSAGTVFLLGGLGWQPLRGEWRPAEAEAEAGAVTGHGGTLASIGRVADVTLALSYRFVNPAHDSRLRLYFRATDGPGGARSGYVAEVTPTETRVRVLRAEGAVPVDGAAHDALATAPEQRGAPDVRGAPDGWTTLQVQTIGAQHRVSRDGTLVAAFDDSRFGSGRFLIDLDTGVRANFRRFEIVPGGRAE